MKTEHSRQECTDILIKTTLVVCVVLSIIQLMTLIGTCKGQALAGESEKDLSAASDDSLLVKKLEAYCEGIENVIAKADSLGIELDSLDARINRRMTKLKTRLDKVDSHVKKIATIHSSEIKDLKQKTGDSIYIICYTIDATDTVTRIPDVSLIFFFGYSLDSISFNSGPVGRYIVALPKDFGNHLIIEGSKKEYEPYVDTMSITMNPLLLRVPFRKEYPTRRISVALKKYHYGRLLKKLPRHIFKVKWLKKIRGSYETDKDGFIPGVEVPLDDKIIVEYKVLRGEKVLQEWEPIISGKIPNKWDILIKKIK